MEYFYATVLLQSVGRDLTESNLAAVLAAAGVDVDDDRVAAVVETFDVGSEVRP